MKSRKAIVRAGAGPLWRSKSLERLWSAMGPPALVIAAWLSNPAQAGDCAHPEREGGADAAQSAESAAPHDPCADLAAATEANLRKAVSLNFAAIKVRALLNLLSDASDVYMYATESVNGSVALAVSNAPVKKVLADLAQNHRWVYKTVADSVIVGPAAEVNEAIEKKLFWTTPR